MPKYKVLETSYLPDVTRADGSSRVYQVGEEVEYVGQAGANLEALDDEGRAQQAAYRAGLEKLRADRLAQFPPESQAGADAFAKLLIEERAKDKESMATMVAAAVSQALAAVLPQGKRASA